MDEFEIIQRFFAGQADAPGIIVGIGDDGAVLAPADDRHLVTVVDTLVEGRHFPTGLDAGDIGWRAVAVNLSDIAAMGAAPRWMTLALTLTTPDTHWLEGFARGLFDAAGEAGVVLVGGDTTGGAQVVVTVQITGDIGADLALRRSGARPGDAIFISGYPGDAAGGLAQLKADLSAHGALVDRFRRPQPRLQLGRELAGLATACIDVSDGLAGDLHKLLVASGVGASVDLCAVPISPALATFAQEDAMSFALHGGDDYELCFSASAECIDTVLETAARCATPVAHIGRVTAARGLSFLRDGEPMAVDTTGYAHFGREA